MSAPVSDAQIPLAGPAAGSRDPLDLALIKLDTYYQ
jgi:hypothetical protein